MYQDSQEAPQLDSQLAKSMRKSLTAFVLVSAALLLLTWVYLSGYEQRTASGQVTLPHAAATDTRS